MSKLKRKKTVRRTTVQQVRAWEIRVRKMEKTIKDFSGRGEMIEAIMRKQASEVLVSKHHDILLGKHKEMLTKLDRYVTNVRHDDRWRHVWSSFQDCNERIDRLIENRGIKYRLKMFGSWLRTRWYGRVV